MRFITLTSFYTGKPISVSVDSIIMICHEVDGDGTRVNVSNGYVDVKETREEILFLIREME